MAITTYDFMNRNMDAYTPSQVPNQRFRQLDFSKDPNMRLAYENLMEVIGSRGKVDPMVRIRNQEEISRAAQGRRQQNTGNAAQMGLQGAGLVDAINQSITATEARDLASEDFLEAAKSEEQMRKDLSLVMDMLVNPQLTMGEILEQERLYGKASAEQRKAADDQKTAQMIGTIISIVGLAMACWTARAIFGADDDRWLDAREYILNDAPEEFRNAYLLHGASLAVRVHDDPDLKARLTPAFEHFAALGRARKEVSHG